MLIVEQIIRMINRLVDFNLKSDNYQILFYGGTSTAECRSCKKIVIKLESYNEKCYILKGYFGVAASVVLERQLFFSELLREKNINTPHHYILDSSFQYVVNADEQNIIVTLEDFIPGKLVNLTKDTINMYTLLMAETHVVSEVSSFQIGRQAKWYNYSQKNEVIRFDKFLRMRDIDHLSKHKDLFDKIVRKSEIITSMINEMICQLPQVAVHGDFSQSNIIKDENNQQYYIIDFDQASDCNLISDFVLQSSLWIETIEVQNNYSFFKMADHLLKIYGSVRRTNKIEVKLAMLMYKMARAFYYKRVKLIESNTIKTIAEYREILEQMDDSLTI